MRLTLKIGLLILWTVLGRPASGGGELDQKDIIIDPTGANISLGDGTYSGSGAPDELRHDVVLHDYGLCHGARELSEVLIVATYADTPHWLYLVQSAPKDLGGPVRVWVDGVRIGQDLGEVCKAYPPDRTCTNAGLPEAFRGSAGGKIMVRYKGTGDVSFAPVPITLKYKRVNREVCN